MREFAGLDLGCDTAGVTTGIVNDAKVMANLVREHDTAVYGDKGHGQDFCNQRHTIRSV